jgi:hypothetical protein
MMMLTAKRLRELLGGLTRAQFEHLLEQAGDRAPQPQRAGTVRLWREQDLDALQLLVSEAVRVGGLRR